ncbi:MAG: hypothetical protein KBB52_06835 [Candidatus Omnitrophica bacterium]|nr:hypothetical protein [Candidatus Omnitrophota bacterium]
MSSFSTFLKTAIVLSFAAGAIVIPVSSQGAVGAGRYGYDDYAPQVRLISPVGVTVRVNSGEGILFKWSWMEGNRLERQYYDFRIYKGYDMLESTLIYKARIPPDTDRVMIESGIFGEDGIYTWCVRQRYYGLARSRRSYASFKVVKE